MAVDALLITCPLCKQPIARIEVVEQSEQAPRFEFYQCQQDGCLPNKYAVVWERGDGLGPPEPGFVDREIARRGAFFPSDYLTTQRGPRNW